MRNNVIYIYRETSFGKKLRGHAAGQAAELLHVAERRLHERMLLLQAAVQRHAGLLLFVAKAHCGLSCGRCRGRRDGRQLHNVLSLSETIDNLNRLIALFTSNPFFFSSRPTLHQPTLVTSGNSPRLFGHVHVPTTANVS